MKGGKKGETSGEEETAKVVGVMRIDAEAAAWGQVQRVTGSVTQP